MRPNPPETSHSHRLDEPPPPLDAPAATVRVWFDSVASAVVGIDEGTCCVGATVDTSDSVSTPPTRATLSGPLARPGFGAPGAGSVVVSVGTGKVGVGAFRSATP